MPLSTRIDLRASEGLQRALVQAAERNLTNASEYARQAILKQLRADGCAPPDGYALVRKGELFRNAELAPVTVSAEHGKPAGYSQGYPDDCSWLPIVNVDSAPFDAAQHYRLPPSLRVNGDHVQRVYPVVSKTDARAL